MAAERKIQTEEERLKSLVDLGVRDAKVQPDVPSITLIPRLHSDLMRKIFDIQEREYCEDISEQAVVVVAYLIFELSRRGESNLNPTVKIFEDKRNNDFGLFVFLKGENGRKN